MTSSDFHHFYQKTPNERQNILAKNAYLTPQQVAILQQGASLPLESANALIENAIGLDALPFGVATQFVVDDTPYIVPMAIEEPSVIAAASNGARLASLGGGFHTTLHNREMIGEIAFTKVDRLTLPLLIEWITNHQEELLTVANQAHPSLSQRGGGARRIWHQCFPNEQETEYLVVYLSADTKEAMGANMLNTMLEAVAAFLNQQFTTTFADAAPELLLAILSNYATESLVTAHATIPFSALDRNDHGEQVATKIAKASRLAQFDTYRATTHNKGIMNGVDAVVLATGNDWRAIEAGAHAYATKDGHYHGLSSWRVDVEAKQLYGSLTLPLPIGTVGGAIKVHPTAQIAHTILHHPTAEQLMRIIASVGLAQNLAALKALVTTGIQAGHMALQARTLALQAGATTEEMPTLVADLVASHDFSLANAQYLLQTYRHQ